MKKPKAPETGIVCPGCGGKRGEIEGWFATALDEFYDPEKSLRHATSHPAQTKREVTRSAQAISFLGHFQDLTKVKHSSRKHRCIGLVETGLFQSVELLNRALLHLALGVPTVGLSLTRMALEVGVRSALEQVVYDTASLRVDRRTSRKFGKRFRAYVELCSQCTEKDAGPRFANCSRELLRVNWPDPELGWLESGMDLSPESLGWAKACSFLEDAGLLMAGDTLRIRLEAVYGGLSAAVHQRKSELEVSQAATFGHADLSAHADERGWIIRGVPPLPPEEGHIARVREVVDLSIAMIVSANALYYKFQHVTDELGYIAWRLDHWPALPVTRSVLAKQGVQPVEPPSVANERLREAKRQAKKAQVKKSGRPPKQPPSRPAADIRPHTVDSQSPHPPSGKVGT